jgi:hypothetical protein
VFWKIYIPLLFQKIPSRELEIFLGGAQYRETGLEKLPVHVAFAVIVPDWTHHNLSLQQRNFETY